MLWRSPVDHFNPELWGLWGVPVPYGKGRLEE
jgi:hypothetical protein